MITTQLVNPVELYRMNTPRYASTPLSGAGSAKGGGRFNRIGLGALYLSLDELTAVKEYKQTAPHLPPGTLCSYTGNLPPLVDLRELKNDPSRWHDIWQDWNMDWRLAKADGLVDPATWDMADLAIDAGVPGIIFESTVNIGGINVVLFVDALRGIGTIDVNDPNAALPVDQASWR